MNTGVRDWTIRCIWQGMSSVDIVKTVVARFDMSPRGREEQEVEHHVARLRQEIADLVKDLPYIIDAALRKGFSRAEVKQVIDEQSGHLIPGWNLQILIDGTAEKIAKEKEREQEAAERAESDRKMAAIQKRIEDARTSIRAMGIKDV